MSNPSAHPLLRLVDANKNSLKCALVKYIDVTVERQFGQFRNQIVEMIESGEIDLVDVNASNQQSNNFPSLVSTITTSPLIKQEFPGFSSTTTINVDCNAGPSDDDVDNDDDEDSEDEGEIISDYAECEDCLKGICGLVCENDNAQDNHVSNKVDTEIGIRAQGAHGSLANGDIIPDAIDDISNQFVQNTNDNDNLNNVAITTSIQRQDTQHSADEDVNGVDDQQNNTSIPSSVFYSNDQITLPPTNDASLKSGHPMPGVIDDNSNQSANGNANNLSILINESEHQQIRSVRKSRTRNVPTPKQNSGNDCQSGQPVIELDRHQLINIPSTSSGRGRSSGRKRIQTKLFGKGQSSGEVMKSDKRKCSPTESSKAVKKVKPATGGDRNDHQPINTTTKKDTQVEKAQGIAVILKLDCTDPGCKAILNSTQVWRQHLSTVHGEMQPCKPIENIKIHQRRFPCNECKVVRSSQQSIHSHWRQYHLKGKYKCCDCEFVGNFRRVVYQHHMKSHKKEKDSLNRGEEL